MRCRHSFLEHTAGTSILGLLQLLLKAWNGRIGQLTGHGKVTLALGLVEMHAGLLELFLHLGGRRQLVFLILPTPRHGGGFFLEASKFDFKFLQTVPRCLIGFFLQCLALDLQLHDAAVDLVQFLRL